MYCHFVLPPFSDCTAAGTQIAEVDSSLTTGELQELLDKYGQGDLKSLPPGRGDNLLGLLMRAAQQQQQQQQGEPLRVPEPAMHAQPGSSGGYADFIFAAAATELFGVDLSSAAGAAAGGAAAADSNGSANLANGSSSNPSSGSSSGSCQQLPWKVLRNADMQELQLLDADGVTLLLRFARAYGFRNIQTIVRQIKTGRCVETQAQQGTCVGGGVERGGGFVWAHRIRNMQTIVKQIKTGCLL
jgi:iron only hydrogenase large subunit-like protein